MGVFGTSQGDKPSLTITLDASLVYAPGSRISGQVKLSNCERHGGDMVVSLSGLSKVKIVESNGQSTIEYRGRAALLNIHQPVASAAQIQADGTTVWPFSFIVPRKCTLEGLPPVLGKVFHDSKYYTTYPEAAHYNCSPGQTLPPSYQSNERRPYQHISYVVTAELHVPPGDLIHAIHNVIITSTPEQHRLLPPITCSDTITISSPLLDPANSDRAKLSFREKTSVFFGSSKLPRSTLRWTATLPRHFRFGSPLRLDLALQPSPAPNDAPAPDTVSVEEVDVRIRAETWHRAPSSSKYQKTRHRDTTIFRQKLSDGVVPPLCASSKYTTTAWTSPNTVGDPSFATHNIARAYHLDVEWTLRAAGQKHEVPVRVLDVQVYVDPAFAQNVARVEVDAAGAPVGVPQSNPSATGKSDARTAATAAAAGSSTEERMARLSVGEGPAPPAYDEPGPSERREQELPGYEKSQYIVQAEKSGETSMRQ